MDRFLRTALGCAHRLRLAPGGAVPLVIAMIAVGPAQAAERPGADSSVIEGRYLVVLADGAEGVAAATGRRERRLGFRSTLQFRHVIRGFSAKLSPAQVSDLRADPGIELVAPERRLRAAAAVPLQVGESPPTGVRRIGAATAVSAHERSEAAVAVLDTGVQLDHPDLNARHGHNCISPGASSGDGDGHGTHVAGTIGATNDGAGVIGVAPGTEIHAVKVLDDDGKGTTSSVVCGIDWVTAHHDELGIRVANMSLGGIGSRVRPCETTDDPMHLAICESTAAGVNYVVSAGNDGWAFDHATEPDLPAAYPQVLTATAIADGDGRPGGLAGALDCRAERDDRPASFSNFAQTAAGEVHTIAAPGVCIRSTLPTAWYGTYSGTSMASPHVAAAVALCIDEAGAAGPCSGKPPAGVIAQMRADAASQDAAQPGYGYLGDPTSSPVQGRYYGFLTRVIPPVVAPGQVPAPDPPAPGPAPSPAPDLDPSPSPDGGAERAAAPPRIALAARDRDRGTAMLRVSAPGPGHVVLARSRKVRRFAADADQAGRASLWVRPRGQAKRRLDRARRHGETARVRVSLRITFPPAAGEPQTKLKRTRLVVRGR